LAEAIFYYQIIAMWHQPQEEEELQNEEILFFVK